MTESNALFITRLSVLLRRNKIDNLGILKRSLLQGQLSGLARIPIVQKRLGLAKFHLSCNVCGKQQKIIARSASDRLPDSSVVLKKGADD